MRSITDWHSGQRSTTAGAWVNASSFPTSETVPHVSHSAGATYFLTLSPDFATTRQLSVEPFGETADPPLAARIGAEPYTIERLVETVRNAPELLSSRL